MPAMASSSSPAAAMKSITVPALVLLSATSAAFLLFLILPSLSPSPASPSCSCPTSPVAGAGAAPTDPISATADDISWLKYQIAVNDLPSSSASPWHELRKGINPRSRDEQLADLKVYKGVSHYLDPSVAANHTALPCFLELLVEEHHSYYGEPWAGGRDVFEFLASASGVSPSSTVLEIGCGTLRVGLHFIRYLDASRFHCLERDELSLTAALRYELPSQGLVYKRPMILRGEDMDFSRFGGDGVVYDLVYASAAFLHMPDALVWVGLERIAARLRTEKGRIFVSHNIKFCSRLGGVECTKRLEKLGLEYVGKRTHDSLLFNHYEIWFEFRRPRKAP